MSLSKATYLLQQENNGWLVEDNLHWKTTFIGRQPSLDPCMMPTPLNGIFPLRYHRNIIEIKPIMNRMEV